MSTAQANEEFFQEELAEAKAVAYAAGAADMRALAHRYEVALRNVLMLAQRMRRRAVKGERWDALAEFDHLIRFCAEVGVVPTVLRGALDAADEGKGAG